MKKFHLNKVNGWKGEKISIQKKEKRLKTSSKKISINYSLMLSMEKRWKLYGIGSDWSVINNMNKRRLQNNNLN